MIFIIVALNSRVHSGFKYHTHKRIITQYTNFNKLSTWLYYQLAYFMLYIADNRKMHYVKIIKSDCIMSKLPHMPDIYTPNKHVEKV